MSGDTSDTHITLRFPPAPNLGADDEVEESYQLLELPAEILKQVEGGLGEDFP
jgi:hypothetical protein